MGKEEFKEFAKSHPELVTHIKSGKMKWQDFYEIYDIFGEDEEAWKPYLKGNKSVDNSATIDETNKTSSSPINDITKVFKNMDVKNIQKHIGTAQKAIGLFQELTTKSTAAGGVAGALGALSAKPSASRPINKFFED